MNKKMESKKVILQDGNYICDIDVSVEEWKSILKDETLMDEKYKDWLIKFYNEQGHKSTCKTLGEKYNVSYNLPNAAIRDFAKAVRKKLGFEVVGTDGQPTYWIIPMTGKTVADGFEWAIRPELVQAMEETGMTFFIKKEILELLFEKFKKKARHDDGSEFVSFNATWKYYPDYDNDKKTAYEEGYKKGICKKASNLFENANWKKEDIGSGKIFATVNENVQKNSVNLITNYIPKDNFKKMFETNNSEELKDFEELLYYFYTEKENYANDNITFEKLFTEYDLKYNLIAYLFFIKQPAKYMPIAQERFNKIFKNVLQIDFRLAEGKDTSWNNYTTYNQIIEQVRGFLVIKGKECTLLDAHSFLWVMQDEKFEINIDKNMEKFINLLKSNKNLILTGAPGTGKTYKTAEIALQIIGKTDIDFSDRKAVMEAYKQAVKNGFISFTTFHQSLDYEEFIEGLKPDIDDSNQGMGTYSVKSGIFKEICGRASASIVKSNTLNIRQDAVVWKVSLKGTGDNDVRTDCLNNNRIRIGWNNYGKEITDDMNFGNGGKFVLDMFINKMQIGDIVISCYSNKIIDAIGIVKGEYEWRDEFADYKRCRDVEWLVKNIREDIYELNNQTVMTLSTVYQLKHISIEKVISVLEKYNAANTEILQPNNQQYVLIIDEINRGNISKILGELITLLEKDKRLGEENEIIVTLPYSKEKFGVPSNLYIIGTMNTADRSIGHIDYAIRRRFAFIPVKADEKVIENYTKYEEDAKQKSLYLFGNIQKFISDNINDDLDAEDLMIGHSYFLCKTTDDLKRRLEYEIIPLVEEYEKDGIIMVEKQSLKDKIKEWKDMIS